MDSREGWWGRQTVEGMPALPELLGASSCSAAKWLLRRNGGGECDRLLLTFLPWTVTSVQDSRGLGVEQEDGRGRIGSQSNVSDISE